jgi:hypothetical protein
MLLRQISLQLSHDGIPQIHTPPFIASPSAIRVNIMWFLSLVLSLTAALFGILLKEWIREYMRWILISPPQIAVGLRQYRFEGLQRWKLRRVLGVLPGLLQLALLLFFCGLLDFLLQLHPIVAAVVGLVTVLFLTLALCTTVISVFSRSSPFRSPVSSILLRTRSLFRTLVAEMHTLARRHFKTVCIPSRTSTRHFDTAEFWRHTSWEELDLRTVEGADRGREFPQIRKTEVVARIRAIHHLCANVTDVVLLDKVRPCLYEPSSGRDSLANCWPVASAVLGIEITDMSVRQDVYQRLPVEYIELSIPARNSVESRADDLSLGARRFLVTVLVEAISDNAWKSAESEILSVMYLLQVLTKRDTELARRYHMVLASLTREQSSHDVVSLALSHMRTGLFRLQCHPHPHNMPDHYVPDAIVSLMKITLQVHRNMHGTDSPAHLFADGDIYSTALFAARDYKVNSKVDMIFKSRLDSLLWALEEHLSFRAGPPPYQSYSTSHLDARCWAAVANILETHGDLVPQPLVGILAKCIGVNLEGALYTDRVSILAAAIERWRRS